MKAAPFLFIVLIHCVLFSAAQSPKPASCNTIDWAIWSSSDGKNAAGTINRDAGAVGVTFTSTFDFTPSPGITHSESFNRFKTPIPASAVPRTAWSGDAGGKVTICFSEAVKEPVLLLASLGDVKGGIQTTLTFSEPFVVTYNGGGLRLDNNTTLTGREGYGIIKFPGDIKCVTITSSNTEGFTDLTWGIPVCPEGLPKPASKTIAAAVQPAPKPEPVPVKVPEPPKPAPVVAAVVPPAAKPEPAPVKVPEPAPKPAPVVGVPPPTPKPEPAPVKVPEPAPKPAPVVVVTPPAAKPEPVPVKVTEPAPKPAPVVVVPPPAAKPEPAPVKVPEPAPKPAPVVVVPPPAAKPDPAPVKVPEPAPKPAPVVVVPPPAAKPEPAPVKVIPPAPKPNPVIASADPVLPKPSPVTQPASKPLPVAAAQSPAAKPVVAQKPVAAPPKPITKALPVSASPAPVKDSRPQIEVWDYSGMDYDSVSIKLNGRQLGPKEILLHLESAKSSSKTTFPLDLQPGDNTLEIYAISEGLKPFTTIGIAIITAGKPKKLYFALKAKESTVVHL